MIPNWVRKFQFGIAVLATCATAHATVVFNVNNELDEVDNDVLDGVCLTAAGTCTLRAAMMQANHLGLPVKINLPPGTYPITIPRTDDEIPKEERGAFDVHGLGDVTIVGVDARTTIIDGNGLDTVFFVGVSPTSFKCCGNLELHNLMIRGGSGQFSTTNTMFHVAGAIFNDGGTALLADCVVKDNVGYYGALEMYGPTTITRTSIASNQGGGVTGGPLVIIDSTIEGNFSGLGSPSGYGISVGGDTIITGSTIANNSGSGLRSLNSNLIVINSTIANNSAESGGGVYYEDDVGTESANLYNTTIAYNTATTGAGGGVFIDSGSFNIYNTLIANNTRGDSIADDCNGSIYSHANNLFGTTHNCLITKINASQYGLLNSLEFLGSLANNGGLTQTIALLAGSNAIDGGAKRRVP